MSDRQVFRVRRVECNGLLRSDADRFVVVVTDEPDRFPRSAWFGFSPHFGQIESLSATPEEHDRWHAAGLAYLGTVEAAVADLKLVRQRWKWWQLLNRLPVAGSWISSKVAQGEQDYLHRVGEATKAYQPSLRQVEQRLAELDAERREKARQQLESQQAAQRAAEARFEAELQAWQRDSETRSADVERNVRAREEAAAEVVAAIKRARTALESAGRPGIQARSGSVSSPSTVRGWEVTFRWADSPVAAPSVTPPRPPCHCYQPIGWVYGVFGDRAHLPEVVLTASDDYQHAGVRDRPTYRVARKRQHGWTDYNRHQWRWDVASPAEFAGDVFDDRVYWLCDCSAKPPPFQLAEHADPDQYVPYVRQLARVAASGFGKVVTDQLDAVSRAQRNRRARHDAKQLVVEAVEHAWRALEEAGRPGLGPVRPEPRYSEEVAGWRVDFDWSTLTTPRPVVTPPPMSPYSGRWVLLDSPHPRTSYAVLTQDGDVAEPQRVTYHAWDLFTPADFAERVVFDWIIWWPDMPAGTTQPFLIADYADPDEYLPYARGIAEVITRGFTAITPSTGL